MSQEIVTSTKRHLAKGRVARLLFTRLDAEGSAVLAEVRARLEAEEGRPLSLPYVIRRSCQLALLWMASEDAAATPPAKRSKTQDGLKGKR